MCCLLNCGSVQSEWAVNYIYINLVRCRLSVLALFKICKLIFWEALATRTIIGLHLEFYNYECDWVKKLKLSCPGCKVWYKQDRATCALGLVCFNWDKVMGYHIEYKPQCSSPITSKSPFQWHGMFDAKNSLPCPPLA